MRCQYQETRLPDSWHPFRAKLRDFFHSNTFHFALGILIFTDLGIVLADIGLYLHYHENMPPRAKLVTHYLTWCSIVILTVFFIELCAQVFAFGASKWFHSWMHIFDFCVVLITLIAEIVVHLWLHNELSSLVGLSIIFRFWRVIRVVHVTTEALDLPHETEIHKLEHRIKELEEQLKKYEAAEMCSFRVKNEPDAEPVHHMKNDLAAAYHYK